MAQNDNDQEQKIADALEKHLNTASANGYYSSQRKAAFALDHLVGEVVDLRKEIEKASSSST